MDQLSLGYDSVFRLLFLLTEQCLGFKSFVIATNSIYIIYITVNFGNKLYIEILPNHLHLKKILT